MWEKIPVPWNFFGTVDDGDDLKFKTKHHKFELWNGDLDWKKHRYFMWETYVNFNCCLFFAWDFCITINSFRSEVCIFPDGFCCLNASTPILRSQLGPSIWAPTKNKNLPTETVSITIGMVFCWNFWVGNVIQFHDFHRRVYYKKSNQ